MCDILNEPDFGNLRWEPANGLPGMGDLYLQAMDALYAANPGLLFFVEGEQNQGRSLPEIYWRPKLQWHGIGRPSRG